MFVVVVQLLSHVRLFTTPWTATLPGSSIHGITHGLPFPFPGDLSDPGIEPVSLASPVLSRQILYH